MWKYGLIIKTFPVVHKQIPKKILIRESVGFQKEEQIWGLFDLYLITIQQ